MSSFFNSFGHSANGVLFPQPQVSANGVLFPQPQVKAMPPTLKVHGLYHWTTGEVPVSSLHLVPGSIQDKPERR